MYKYASRGSKKELDSAQLTFLNDNTISLSGEWNWATISESILLSINNYQGKNVVVDGCGIKNIDTTGMYFIHRLLDTLQAKGVAVKDVRFDVEAQKLFNLTTESRADKEEVIVDPPLNALEVIGSAFAEVWHTALQLLAFFGQLCYALVTMFKREYSLYMQGVVETISSAGIQGVFISSTLCFLIGVNLTYQMAPQFVTYGANIYVVNFLGIALLREVTPLLTAIIVAGRSGSAIAASIGTMQVQEEIDALKTMGISPIRRLVMPKVIGMVLALPILTMLADVASMFGGMIFAGPLMGVSPDLFLSRLQANVSINNFWIGILKSVFFAWIIAMVGCFCGFKVKSNADSVGVQTTRSVVMSICLIIIVDALFAILFKALGVK